MTSESREHAGLGMSATSQLAGRTLWNLTGIVVTNLARLVAMAMVGQAGGAATLGNVQTAVSSANLAAMTGPISVGNAAGRYLPRSGSRSASVAARLLRHGTGLGLLFAVLCGAAFLPFFGPAVALAVLLLTFVMCQWVVSRGIAIADGTPLRSMIGVEGIGALTVIVSMAVLVALGAPWHAYLVAFALMQVPLILSVRLRLRLRHRRRGGGDSVVGDGYRRYVTWGVVGTIASGGLVHLTAVVTNGFGGAVEAGHLAAGLLLVSPLGMLTSALAQVSLPWLSRLLEQQRDDEAKARARDLSAAIHAVVGSALLLLVPLGPWLARLLFGPDVRLDHATLIALGGATVALSGRLGAVALLSARGHVEVRRMALLSYGGLGTALLVWGAAWTVRGHLSAFYAGVGYALGATVVTVLITAVAHGARVSLRSLVGTLCWLAAIYGLIYASDQLGVPPVLALTMALGLWVVSARDGIRFLTGWARVWAGER